VLLDREVDDPLHIRRDRDVRLQDVPLEAEIPQLGAQPGDGVLRQARHLAGLHPERDHAVAAPGEGQGDRPTDPEGACRP
jgi:hypothetical protein